MNRKNKEIVEQLERLGRRAWHELSCEDTSVWLAKCYGALIGVLQTTGDMQFFCQVIEKELERMIKLNKITVEGNECQKKEMKT